MSQTVRAVSMVEILLECGHVITTDRPQFFVKREYPCSKCDPVEPVSFSIHVPCRNCGSPVQLGATECSACHATDEDE